MHYQCPIVDTAYFLPGTERESAALAYPKSKASLANVGGTLRPMTPADFGKLIADETEKWGKVVKFAGLKAD
jgi:tripartite-type tricarboxylate transporter receptor subunit TctC